MLDLITGRCIDCEGVPRRTFLRIGGLGTLGLSLADYLQARAGNRRKPAAVRCILLWMQGGPSHLDTFDPKPEAPTEIRGPFGTVATPMPGVHFSEHLPQLAQRAKQFSVIRGHHPRNGSHGVADHLMMSGHPFNPSLVYPCYGSVVAKERGARPGMFPFVQLGRDIDARFHGGEGGFLGDTVNPFVVKSDPNARDFRVANLSLPVGRGAARFRHRYAMLQDLQKYQRKVEARHPSVAARDAFYAQAHALMTSKSAQQAFDLGKEPAKLREQYGRNRFGQSCLLARRLIEAGVHFVTVTDGGWDTHKDNFNALKERKLPVLDHALASLLDDLGQRGLLETTLIAWFGDFGRTPKINPDAGRDHWSSAGVIVLAGGGIRPGQVIGQTSAMGEFVTDTPVTPQDLAATLYQQLGIPLHTRYQTPDGRPVELVPTGKPIRDLL